MPNTLVHMGIQGLTSKGFFPKIDLKWVYLGCLIPDIPWILQRVVGVFVPDINPYDLRLYAIVQASFLFCLLFSLAFSFFSNVPAKAFLILSVNSFFHLFLDSLEIKWANGVHFLAPFHWQLFKIGWIWPESFWVTGATFFGIFFFFMSLRFSQNSPWDIPRKPAIRFVLVGFLLAVYFILPYFLLTGPEKADNHFVATFREVQNRPGKYVELDRKKVFQQEEKVWVQTFGKEKLEIQGNCNETEGIISLRGKFFNKDVLLVDECHKHFGSFRDKASYLGIALFIFYWGVQFFSRRRRFFYPATKKKPNES